MTHSIQGLYVTVSVSDTQHNDIQHNDIQHNDIQHNDTKHKGIKCDTQHE
jgi:hypothetical protein